MARLRQPDPTRRSLQSRERAARVQQAVLIASANCPAARLVPLLPARLVPLLPARLVRLLPGALTLASGPSAAHLAKLTVSSLTARRSLTKGFRV